MLNGKKLKEICKQSSANINELAEQIVRGGLDRKSAVSAIKNWQKCLYKPAPKAEDVRKLASTLGIEATKISEWRSDYMYAPMSPSKARLVSALIAGRPVQDALDLLKFTNKRAASMINQVLKCAVANADEGQADVENLYVSESRIDGAGRRIGTKTWIPKDRGRAHPIKKQACHIHVAVAEI